MSANRQKDVAFFDCRNSVVLITRLFISSLRVVLAGRQSKTTCRGVAEELFGDCLRLCRCAWCGECIANARDEQTMQGRITEAGGWAEGRWD
jgi:hypothetical protein